MLYSNPSHIVLNEVSQDLSTRAGADNAILKLLELRDGYVATDLMSRRSGWSYEVLLDSKYPWVMLQKLCLLIMLLLNCVI